MDKKHYRERSDACLERIARWLENFDPDEVDYGTSDGVVKIQFPEGSTFVLNRQAAVDQMWFAAGARAWHYGWDDARNTWIDDRDGHDLFDNIGKVVSEKLGRRVRP